MHVNFHSHETGKAFTGCCDCGCALTGATSFIVNQSYVGEECVLELALCMDCREKMNNQLSEQSRVAMFDFIYDNTDMESRLASLGSDSETEAYIASCITCGRPRCSTKSYTVGALFSGEQLIKGAFPMLICGDCEVALAESISDETRNVWDHFIAEHFPGPPSEIQLPTGTKPILI